MSPAKANMKHEWHPLECSWPPTVLPHLDTCGGYTSSTPGCCRRSRCGPQRGWGCYTGGVGSSPHPHTWPYRVPTDPMLTTHSPPVAWLVLDTRGRRGYWQWLWVS